MERIFWIICNWRRSSLGTRPEWLSIFIFGIMREDTEKVLDLVIEHTFEMETSNFDTFIEIS